MSERIADIIDQAADYLDSHGWWRGGLRGPNGRQVCAVGAIRYSQGWAADSPFGSPTAKAVENAMMRVIEKERVETRLHVRYFGIEGWNDYVARDRQHVLDVMRKAAKWERAGYDPDA